MRSPDNPADALFQLDPTGKMVFYPWGKLWYGYLVPDFLQQQHLYTAAEGSYSWLPPLIVLASVLGIVFAPGVLASVLGVVFIPGVLGFLIALTPVLVVWVMYAVQTGRYLWHLPRSPRPLTWAELYPEGSRVLRHQIAMMFDWLLGVIGISGAIWLFARGAYCAIPVLGLLVLVWASNMVSASARRSLIVGLGVIAGILLWFYPATWTPTAILGVLIGICWAARSYLHDSRSPNAPTPLSAAPVNPFRTRPYLQGTFTPAEYPDLIRAVEERSATRMPNPQAEEFWARIPRYLVARCPFCGSAHEEILDTHSLALWYFHPNRQVVGSSYGSLHPAYRPQRGECAHLMAVQSYLNLNGTPSTEYAAVHNEEEAVPYVLTEFLPDLEQTQAVMHSFPICRIEENQFVPRHIVYTIAYYAQESAAFYNRVMARPKYQLSAEDSAGGAALFGPGDRIAFNLSYWVAQGKLQWLDPDAEGLPLRGGAVEEFPYRDIRGPGFWAGRPLYEQGHP